jgi:phosphohistidine phosphatase SixA
MAQLAKVAKRRHVALVGHEPDLGELAAYLIGAGRALTFKKGSVCRIDVGSLSARRAGSLIWFVPPGLLRQLKK